jgi:two-component system sensor histidine kinase/response regulator
MDCQMPEMDGYEATRRIRDLRTGVYDPKVPIIALTAYAMKGDRDRCLAAGMDDYIPKPVHPTTVAAALQKWLPPEVENSVRGEMPQGPMRTGPQLSLSSFVFDEAGLIERMMGDRELARSIVGTFLVDIPKQLAALESQLKASDTAAAARQAHRIKGAAASVSAGALQKLALEIEEAASAGHLKAMAARFPELQREFHLARERMRKL